METMATEAVLLRIELLGGLRIRCNGRDPVEIPGNQPGTLLALLALDLRHRITREEITERLWPDDEPERARHRLRDCLHALRRLLEQTCAGLPDVLIATRTTVRLNPELVSTDVAEFEIAMQAAISATDPAERARLVSQATGVYHGELLPGFYQDCFIKEQERLAALYERALHVLTQIYEQLGDFERAAETARRAVSNNPLTEEAHCALMRVYSEMGQPSAVLRQFQELERVLMAELGEEPSPTTRVLMESLRQSAQARAASHSNGNAMPLATSDSGVENPPHLSSVPSHVLSQASKPSITYQGHLRYLAAGAAVLLLALAAGLALKQLLSSITQQDPPGKSASRLVPQAKMLWTVRYHAAPDEVDGGQPNAMTVDEKGNIYIAGSVHTRISDADFLVLKYDPSGNLLWHQRYNGPSNDVDEADCIAVDRAGNVYVMGESNNGKGSRLTHLGGRDIVVVKFDSNGARSSTWPDEGFGVGVRRYCGPDDFASFARKLCVDQRDGTVFVLGNSFKRKSSKGESARREEWVVLAFGPDGKRLWVRRERAHSDNADAGADDMVVDASKNIYVTGNCQTGGHTGLIYTFVTIKYGPAGLPLWKRTFGDPDKGETIARRIALDAAGNVYVTGEADTGSTAEGGRRDDIATIKYDSAGNKKWIRFYDFNHLRDWPRKLIVDAAGNIAIAGLTGTGTGPSWKYLTLRYDAYGNLQWADTYDGKGGYQDYIEDLAYDSRGNVILTSRDLNGTPNHEGGSGADYYTIKYGPDGRRIWEARYDYAGLDDLVSGISVDRRDNVIVTGASKNGDRTTSIATIKYLP